MIRKKNELWQLDFRTIRGHTNEQKTKTRLLKIKGSEIANTYFFHGKVIAWDIDNHLDKVKLFEKILGVPCDHSTSCSEVAVSMAKSAKFGHFFSDKGRIDTQGDQREGGRHDLTACGKMSIGEMTG
jgi:hypothetical protein